MQSPLPISMETQHLGPEAVDPHFRWGLTLPPPGLCAAMGLSHRSASPVPTLSSAAVLLAGHGVEP